MKTKRHSLKKNRRARHEPSAAQDTPEVTDVGVTTEGGTVANEESKGDAMSSDENRETSRLTALEMKTAALAAQLIALQATVVALIPVISIVDADDVRDAMRTACRDVVSTLEAARFTDATITDVVREIQVINGDILDRATQSAIGYAVKVLPC